jgi:3-dehydroquinate synthetase
MVKRDKKREKDIIHFVMLKDIGDAFIKDIRLHDLIEWMDNKV